MRGKQAFTFINRASGESVRLVLKPGPDGLSREESFVRMQAMRPVDLFDRMEARVKIPEQARIFQSRNCAVCGERTAENMMRVQNGELVCLDCATHYNRFEV